MQLVDKFKLEAWLKINSYGISTPISLKQFPGGQSNPTFLVTSKDGHFVLRKKPHGELLYGAHQIEREYRIMSQLYNSKVPVPKMITLCEDDSVIGTPFFIMEYIQGKVFTNTLLPFENPDTRYKIYLSLSSTLANLHLLDPNKYSLSRSLRSVNYIERQIKIWKSQFESTQTEKIPEMDFLIEWLEENCPNETPKSFIHGDYRLGNIIFHPKKFNISAVLDWELSTIGHPLADLAYSCLPWHIPINEDNLFGLKGKNCKIEGIPKEEEYLENYFSLTKTSFPSNWNFFLAFSFFRLASISQGVYSRSISGNASSLAAKDYGERAKKFAYFGKHIILSK